MKIIRDLAGARRGGGVLGHILQEREVRPFFGEGKQFNLCSVLFQQLFLYVGLS